MKFCRDAVLTRLEIKRTSVTLGSSASSISYCSVIHPAVEAWSVQAPAQRDDQAMFSRKREARHNLGTMRGVCHPSMWAVHGVSKAPFRSQFSRMHINTRRFLGLLSASAERYVPRRSKFLRS